LAQFKGEHGVEWGPMMAVSTVMIVPVLIAFFFTQRTFVQGITLTGVKG
jgi:multiple sugar transport system permease protein